MAILQTFSILLTLPSLQIYTANYMRLAKGNSVRTMLVNRYLFDS